MFTTLSEIDGKMPLWLHFNSLMSEFKSFERGTKTQDHEGTKQSYKSQPTYPSWLEYYPFQASIPFLHPIEMKHRIGTG